MSISVAEQYIKDAASGAILVSDQVRLTCSNHLKDLQSGHVRGLSFDPEQGNRVIQFIETFCCHNLDEYAGKPFLLEPWQKALLYILYGWRFASSGYRRFTVAYVELCKGNGKSMMASALGLYEMIGTGIQGASVYSVATQREQARIVWKDAALMVAHSPSLSSRIVSGRNNLHIPDSASKFEPLSSEEGSLDGKRPACIIADELHRWVGPNANDLWNVLINALGKVRNPLFFVITTAGAGHENLCWRQRDYSERVLSGAYPDDRHFSWICCLAEGDDPEDSSLWIKSNPNLGVSVKMDELKAVYERAKGDPASLNGVLRLRLGVWSESDVTWMQMDMWDSCTASVSAETLTKRPCFGGLDLSTTTDVSAFVLVFPPFGTDRKWSVLPYFFLPEDNIAERVRRDRVPYDVWERQDLFELTPGNVIDYDFIRHRINELSLQYDIKEIAFDVWNSSQLVTQLQDDGFEMVKFSQRAETMSAPVKFFMELVLKGDLAHGRNPVLRWMASNVIATPDASGIVKLDKSKKREKIDGIVAALMGLGRASLFIVDKPAPAPMKFGW